MSTVTDSKTRPSSLVEAFLHNFQYTLGLLNRPIIDETTFNRAVRNLHGSLTPLLIVRKELRIHVQNGKICLDDMVLPDSYALQKVFIKYRCPAIVFRRELPLAELFHCIKEMDSLLKKELDPVSLTLTSQVDQHHRWIAPVPVGLANAC